MDEKQKQVSNKSISTIEKNKSESKDLKWSKTQGAWIGTYMDTNPRGKLTDDIPNHEVQTFCAQLLKIGGKEVCIWFLDETWCKGFNDFAILNKSQTLKYSKTVTLSDCHYRSAKYWKENPNKYQIVTGYALASDGLWNRHSWLLDNKRNVVETTPIGRDIYYGMPLESEEAKLFCTMYFDNAN